MYMNDGNKTKINLRNKSVFITGVAGFIGSNLAKRLLSTVEGVKVVGLDNMNHYYDVRLKEARLNELEQFDNFSFVKGNLADKAVIESIFEQYKPEIVVNLGAQAGVRYSITNPDAYVEANLIGFYNILEACRHSYDEGHTPVEHLVYVELLLNSVERCIAIRPCDKNNPNAIRWGRLKEGRWCASTLGCRGLAKTLFDIMEWDEDLRYRFRGQFLEQGDNKMMLFAFDEPEMIKVEEIVLPPKENTEEDEGETVKKKIYIFPPEWAGTFGQPITSIAQVGILRQEHYAGNWDVFRPATEIEEMNIFTAESLNELLREAEKIMEGWTDYR